MRVFWQDQRPVALAAARDPYPHSRVRRSANPDRAQFPPDADFCATAGAVAAGAVLAGTELAPQSTVDRRNVWTERLLVARGGVFASALPADHDHQLRDDRPRGERLGPTHLRPPRLRRSDRRPGARPA